MQTGKRSHCLDTELIWAVRIHTKPRRYGFQPGVSGNPGGRPKSELAVRVRLAELTPRMIEEWHRIALDPKERTCDRLRAQENIVFSCIGRPARRIDADVTVQQLRPIQVISPDGRPLKVIDVKE
jgi:hypothetical protein